MPAQKRSAETTTPPPSPPPPLNEEKLDDSLQDSENHNHEQTVNASDSDESSYSSGEEKDEFIVVKLAEIRKEVQCPICLGIIRKTRTVMECLHRFCRECIDKSMRLGNNECPACRTHCASRRSLRDDPNYDALIATLYPDIDKYEEEELAFHEEEKARNKQIQASISQTFRRQAEALGKKRTSARVTAAAFVRRQGNYRNLRGRRNRMAENQGSDEEEGTNGNDGSKDSSSADERSPDIKSKRYKRRRGARTSQTSGANADGGSDDNDSETNRELVSASVGIIGGTEILAWGRGGMRSNTRHGGHSWANSKLSRNNRLSNLIDHLQSSKENEELKVSLTLVSLLEDKIPSLKRPYLCCSSRSSVRHLCQYVAMQTSTEASEVEILIIKDFHPVNNTSSFKNEPSILNACHSELQLLNEHQTLGEIHGSFTQQNLVLAYRRKAQGEGN
ncbi:putative E3 ubiquitin-protein ligase RING1a isoform X2 [Salvia miltiorrhiza]|uniref:putative E3 ubiquitin-protein ligase RING1a isoform X2 n=1 Tax=Salvia miltiorrhiza TaxID=226208 RepID=UPI0025ACFB00|nr:putative E3 ubiquitin-protein ligase RING1a isoform X2 [Salvia miltiorrhiza]